MCLRTSRSNVRMSDADDRPRSSNPWGEAKDVSAILRPCARAFIAVTNAPTLPDSSMASASAASFADPRSRPPSNPRTETRSPGRRPSDDPAPVLPPAEDGVGIDADGSIQTPLLGFEDEQRRHQLREARDRSRRRRGSLIQDLPGGEIHQDDGRGIDPWDRDRVGGRREPRHERGRRSVGRDRVGGGAAGAPIAWSHDAWTIRSRSGRKAAAPAAALRFTRCEGCRAGSSAGAPA